MYVSHILLKHELDAYEKHLLSLDKHSSYMRFGYHITENSIHEFIQNCYNDFENHQIFVITDSEFKILGVSHLYLGSPEIEIALSVLPEYQGKGIGDILMKKTIQWCKNRHIEKAYMVCLRTNNKVKNLAKKHGLFLKDNEDESSANLMLPEPTVDSIMEESIDNLKSLVYRAMYFQKSLSKMFYV